MKITIIFFFNAVAPDAIHHHIKTCRMNMKNMHFVAPEYGSEYIVRTNLMMDLFICSIISNFF